jgi:nucleoside-diphosphate-sugar epimerase
LDNNIKGMYNIFHAAKDQNCRRVIFASSIQAIDGYPIDLQVSSESAPRPLNMYGAAKAFGEATAHYFAMALGLSSIAIRIGAYGGNRPASDTSMPTARNLAAHVSPRDLCQLIVRCIEAEDVQFAIVHGTSDNRFKRMDLTATKAAVGYEPQDDAFQLFDTGLNYIDRWYQENPTRKRPDQDNV